MEPIVNPPPPPPVPPTYGKPFHPNTLRKQTHRLVLISVAVLVPIMSCVAGVIGLAFWLARSMTRQETTGTRGADQVWQITGDFAAVAADGDLGAIYAASGEDLCRIDSAGTEVGRWSLFIEATRLRCAQLDGLPPLEVIATDGHRSVVALSSAGRALWHHDAPADVLDINAGALGGRTNAVAVGTKAGLFVLDSTGKLLFDVSTVTDVASVCMTQAGGGTTPVVGALCNRGTVSMWDRTGSELGTTMPDKGQVVVPLAAHDWAATAALSLRPDLAGDRVFYCVLLDNTALPCEGTGWPTGIPGELISADSSTSRPWVVTGTSAGEVHVHDLAPGLSWAMGTGRLVRQQAGGRPEVAWLEAGTSAEPQFVVANGKSLTLCKLRR